MIMDKKGKPLMHQAQNLTEISYRSKSNPNYPTEVSTSFTPDPSLATFSVMHQQKQMLDQYLSPLTKEMLSK